MRVPGGTASSQRLPVGAVAHGAGAVTAAAGLVAGPAPVALKIPQRGVADGQHVAAAPAVAAVGPAPGHVGFAAEADGAVTARPGLDMDSCAVVEHPASNRDRPAHGFEQRIC